MLFDKALIKTRVEQRERSSKKQKNMQSQICEFYANKTIFITGGLCNKCLIVLLSNSRKFFDVFQVLVLLEKF